ncbi:MAG TPA: protein kinase [Verrucomicrobiae bacterium]|jgi:WD40 repeat protein/serine/threonine protein kinase|nr:protein kinase [Verrucomicrobiae bacterium]
MDSIDPTVVQESATEPFVSESSAIGPYKLLQRIGEGGFGEVWMAEQREPMTRRVALKIIKLGMDTRQVVARFEAERQALALMDHPNIAKVFDGGATENGRPYFVMELVKGVPITDYCETNNISTEERLRLFVQICQAIQHAHQKGIIHRDIKPSNVLVSIQDGIPVPKVIDFGIAKATQQQLTDKTVFTHLQQFIGTPAYMSPEQAEMTGIDIDTRTDVYSLGVLLYELLTGVTPFDGKELLKSGLDEMRRIIRQQDPARPSTRLIQLNVAASRESAANLRPSDKERGARARRRYTEKIDPDLDWIVMKCLEKDRTRRYDTVNGLALDIQRHLDSEPVLARPPTTLYRFEKTWRRNKIVFSAGAAVILSMAVGILLSIDGTHRAKRALQEARSAGQAEKRQRLAAQSAETNAERNLYFAKMNLVRPAWEENNLRRVRRLLGETSESPERGFEWYFWQKQMHLELRTLRGHQGTVLAVAYFPGAEDRRLVTGGTDHTARIWDASSGRQLFLLSGHTDSVNSVAVSRDGRWIVTASSDDTARLWDAATGVEMRTLKGHTGSVTSISLSPDGLRAVTGSKDRTVRVWDLQTGEMLVKIEGRTNQNAVAFSPNGARIAIGDENQTLSVRDSHNGANLFSVSHDGGWIGSVVYSHDGRRIVTGSGGQTVTIWDAETGKVLFTQKAHDEWISPFQDRVPLAVALSPDDRKLLTAGPDKLATLWTIGAQTNLIQLKGHEAEIYAVDFSADGQRIATGSADGTVKIWDWTRARGFIELTGHKAGGIGLAFSPDNRRIVTSSFDRTAKVWETETGRELLTYRGHDDEIVAAAFSPDGKRIITGSTDQTVRVWDSVSGRDLMILTGHVAGVKGVAYSPDNHWIVTTGEDHTARLWDASSGAFLRTLDGHKDTVYAVAFSPNGQWFVTGSEDKTAKLWAAAEGKLLRTLVGHSQGIRAVAFSPVNDRIITASWDGTAVIWETVSGQPLLTVRGHGGQVISAAFSPDGRRVITGSFEHVTRVWDSTTAEELLTLKGPLGGLFSPDGQQIVTQPSPTALLWKVASEQEVAQWRLEEHSTTQFSHRQNE